jgi:hypothetical protein
MADPKQQLTCHVVLASASEIASLFDSDAEQFIKHATPLPPTFKLSPRLLAAIDTGAESPDTFTGLPGIVRVELGPGGDRTADAKWAAGLQEQLRGGAFGKHLRERLYWLRDDKTEEDGDAKEQKTEGKQRQWRRELAPALEGGATACDLKDATVSLNPDGRSLSLDLGSNARKLSSACVLAAVSFLAAQPQAMHLYLLPRDSVPPATSVPPAEIVTKLSVQPIDRGHSRVRKLQEDYSSVMVDWFNSQGVTKGSSVPDYWEYGLGARSRSSR